MDGNLSQQNLTNIQRQYDQQFQNFLNIRHQILVLQEQEKSLEEQLREMKGLYNGYAQAVRDLSSVQIETQPLPSIEEAKEEEAK